MSGPFAGEFKKCVKCQVDQFGVNEAGVCWSCNRQPSSAEPRKEAEWAGTMGGIVWIKCGCGEEVPAAKMEDGKCAWCRDPGKPKPNSIHDLEESQEEEYNDRLMDSAGE